MRSYARLAPNHRPPRGPGPMPPRRLREVVHQLTEQSTPASKLNLVARLIRKLPVEEARTQLRYSNKMISKNVLLALDQAVLKAKSQFQLGPEDLIVGEAFVGGRILGKRADVRGRGRTGVITKKQSDLTLKLYEHPALVKDFKSTTFAHWLRPPRRAVEPAPPRAERIYDGWDAVWQNARRR